MTTRDLVDVIADWRGDAAVLRRRGDIRAAELLELCADQASAAAEEWNTFLSEGEAMLRSGRSRPWLRAQFARWEREGHAKETARHTRIYRQCIVPQKANVTSAASRGREAARKARAS